LARYGLLTPLPTALFFRVHSGRALITNWQFEGNQFGRIQYCRQSAPFLALSRGVRDRGTNSTGVWALYNYLNLLKAPTAP